MSAHTPEPWVVHGDPASEAVYVTHDGDNVARVAVSARMVVQGLEECRANARLIASAPDLLAALERMVGLDWTVVMHPARGEVAVAEGAAEAYSAARSALAKARGTP